MAYLPREKLLFQADLVNTFEPLPARIAGDQRSFFNAVQKLKLDVAPTGADARAPDSVGRRSRPPRAARTDDPRRNAVGSASLTTSPREYD